MTNIALGDYGAITVNGTRLTKEYTELKLTDRKPYLLTASNAIFKMSSLTEHDILKELSTLAPNDYPEIYDYTCVDLSTHQELLTKPIVQRGLEEHNMEELNYCTLTMSYIPYPNLGINFNKLVNTQTQAIHITKLIISSIFNAIKQTHYLPNDFHLENMLYDEPNDKLYLVDVAFWEKVELIDHFTINDVNTSYTISDDNSVSKYSPMGEDITSTIDVQELSDYDIEMLMLDCFRNNLATFTLKGLYPKLYLEFGIGTITIFDSAMKELNMSNKFRNTILNTIVNHQLYINICYSSTSWLCPPNNFPGSTKNIINSIQFHKEVPSIAHLFKCTVLVP